MFPISCEITKILNARVVCCLLLVAAAATAIVKWTISSVIKMCKQLTWWQDKQNANSAIFQNNKKKLVGRTKSWNQNSAQLIQCIETKAKKKKKVEKRRMGIEMEKCEKFIWWYFWENRFCLTSVYIQRE